MRVLILSSNAVAADKKCRMAADGWFWLSVLTVLIFWIPTINVQPHLTTGDMGRDFYAFQLMTQGHWPVRDYWWQYGPLMPVYYAFWFLVGGVNILSVRMGLAAIYLLSSILTYQILRLFTQAPVAFLSSLAFLSFDMTWTFNHIGAIPLLLFSIFSLWKFFLTHHKRWCYLGLLSVVAIAWLKISAGVFSFLAFYASLLLDYGLSGRKNSETLLAWKHFIFLPLLFSVLTLGAYTALYWGVPADWVGQCMTLAPQYGRLTFFWTNLKHLFLRFLIWDRERLFGVAVFLIFGLLALLSLRKKNLSERDKKIYLPVWGSLVIYGVANSADYFLMEGMIYRFDFWLFPIFVLSLGFLAEWASSLFQRREKIILGILIFLGLLIFPFKNFQEALAMKVPERYLDFPQGQVYAGGALASIQAVKAGTRFILENTTPAEKILAIPYEPLYAFLSGRRHALRELIFVEGIHIQPEQEERMIREIEDEQVPLVLISNRYYSTEPGIGYFGKTHCQKLNRYLMDHYEEVQTFGRWEVESVEHAIKIFVRK